MRERLTERSAFVDAPIEAVWQAFAYTERMNQGVGSAEFSVKEVTEPNGLVRRFGSGRIIPPFMCEWQEHFGEWVAPRLMAQRRDFTKGPLTSLVVEVRLEPEGQGTRLHMASRVRWDRWITSIVAALGLIDKATDKRVAAAIEIAALVPKMGSAWSLLPPPTLSSGARARLDSCRAALQARKQDPAMVEKLIEHALGAPFDIARRIRPLALARAFGLREDRAVTLCLEAHRAGLLAMGWDLLCPRCRGAKLRVETLYGLPQGTHCSSCNIDYDRDFARNVELTFRPERWLRELPEGEFCLQGAGMTPHVLIQRRVAAGETIDVTVDLPPGDYRVRTVERGEELEVTLDDDEGAAWPEVIAGEGVLRTGGAASANTLRFRNDTDHPIHLVVEERAWIADALTGEHVIAMPIFRELCPEQVLRAGDEVAISRVAVLFTDLKGSTALYEKIGDATAYGLVRDHFGVLAEIVRSHQGIVVKTMGDCVMAAFNEPADAARAALAISRGVEAFNRDHAATPIALKLGLHAGRCIAVTNAGALDYFGGAVNLAARLEAQSDGGDIVLSEAIAGDAAVAPLIADLPREWGAATLRGFAAPVPFVRLRPLSPSSQQ